MNEPDTREADRKLRDPDVVPAWFSAEIAAGLQAIYALSPEGCPGADVLPATIGVWARDLWASSRRGWHQQADTGCIRSAFSRLRSTCERWPTPAKFWPLLPNRPPAPANALADPNWGRENQDEVLRNMRRQFAEFGEEDRIPVASLR